MDLAAMTDDRDVAAFRSDGFLVLRRVFDADRLAQEVDDAWADGYRDAATARRILWVFHDIVVFDDTRVSGTPRERFLPVALAERPFVNCVRRSRRPGTR